MNSTEVSSCRATFRESMELQLPPNGGYGFVIRNHPDSFRSVAATLRYP